MDCGIPITGFSKTKMTFGVEALGGLGRALSVMKAKHKRCSILLRPTLFLRRSRVLESPVSCNYVVPKSTCVGVCGLAESTG